MWLELLRGSARQSCRASDCTGIGDGIPQINRTAIRLIRGLAHADSNWRRDPADESDLGKLLSGSAHVAWRAWDWIGIGYDPIEFDLSVICGIRYWVCWLGGDRHGVGLVGMRDEHVIFN